MSEFEREVEKLNEEIQASQSTTNGQVTDNGSADEQLRQLESLVKMDPSFADDPEYKDLMAKLQAEKESRQAKVSNNQDDEDEEEESTASSSEEEDEQEDEDNPFYSEKSSKKTKEIPIDFEVPSELNGLLEKNFGVKDLSTFLNSTMTWRQQAQEAADIKKYHEALESDLQAMPYEIKLMIDKWAKGEDYIQPIVNMKRLDYDVDFDKQDVENLVQHYLPEEYDDLLTQLDTEQISEEEFMKSVKLLSKSTKQMFNGDKKALKDMRDEYATKAADEHKAFKKSALVSVESLSKAYPNFSKSELGKIRTTLVEEKLDDLFFNSDGTYREDAAELIAYAMYGKKILNSVKGKAKREGESEANMRIADSSPKTIKKQSSANSGESKVNLNAVSHLQGAFKKDPYA